MPSSVKGSRPRRSSLSRRGGSKQNPQEKFLPSCRFSTALLNLYHPTRKLS